MGIPMSIGTGMFKLLHKYPFVYKTKATVFRFLLLTTFKQLDTQFVAYLHAHGVETNDAFKLQFPPQPRLRALNLTPLTLNPVIHQSHSRKGIDRGTSTDVKQSAMLVGKSDFRGEKSWLAIALLTPKRY